jgi:nitroreductase
MRVRQVSSAELTNMTNHYQQALAVKTPEERLIWAQQQTYIAVGNFLTCAALMSIDTCPMTGIDEQGYDEILGLTAKNLTTTVVCPIGIRHPNDASAHLKKVRFDYDEMVVTH